MERLVTKGNETVASVITWWGRLQPAEGFSPTRCFNRPGAVNEVVRSFPSILVARRAMARSVEKQSSSGKHRCPGGLKPAAG
jgi:hypothetical protein